MSGKSIFVVDDDDMQRAMLVDHVKKNPLYKVQAFSTGEECLQSLSQGPDVVILDYELNSKVAHAQNGYEILQQIKKLDRSICVIMLSSQMQYGKAMQTVVKGALEYIVKDHTAFKKIDGILEGL